MSIKWRSVNGFAWTILALTVLPGAAAKELPAQDAREFSKTLKKLGRLNDPFCSPPASLLNCEAAINTFCKDLYDPKNPKGAGNINDSTGLASMKCKGQKHLAYPRAPLASGRRKLRLEAMNAFIFTFSRNLLLYTQ